MYNLGGSGSLQTDNWYDGRGNLIKNESPSGLVSKVFYDGAGSITDKYFTDGGGDTSNQLDATDVDRDIVIEHQHFELDDDGNVLLEQLEPRQPDDSMRTSYIEHWYDQANRLTDRAVIGAM